jgi:hypothetical protein
MPFLGVLDGDLAFCGVSMSSHAQSSAPSRSASRSSSTTCVLVVVIAGSLVWTAGIKRVEGPAGMFSTDSVLRVLRCRREGVLGPASAFTPPPFALNPAAGLRGNFVGDSDRRRLRVVDTGEGVFRAGLVDDTGLGRTGEGKGEGTALKNEDSMSPSRDAMNAASFSSIDMVVQITELL